MQLRTGTKTGINQSHLTQLLKIFGINFTPAALAPCMVVGIDTACVPV